MTLRNLAENLPRSEELLRAVGRRPAPTDPLALLGSFALGVTAGATLALLFSPSSGRQIRQQLGDQAARVKERMSERLSHAAGSATGGTSAGRTSAV